MKQPEKSKQVTKSQQFYLDFWPELMSELKLDDLSQPEVKRGGKLGDIQFPMPSSRNLIWITAYFDQQKKEVGVFLTFSVGSSGDRAYNKLRGDQEKIEIELGLPVEWRIYNGKNYISFLRNYSDIHNGKYRQEIKSFMNDTINRFINVFQQRLDRY